MAAPASAASVWSKPFSFRTRNATLISVPVTPRVVVPPLLPENAMHGGEYGSPGTCLLRSGQLPLTLASAFWICWVVAAVGSLPAVPAVPFVPVFRGLPACGGGGPLSAAVDRTFDGR